MTWVKRCTEWIGIGDGRGHISFNKSVTAVMVLVFAVVAGGIVFFLRQQPDGNLYAFGVFVTCAGFGLKGIAMFFEHKMWTHSSSSSSTTNTNIDAADMIKAIRARRNPDEGIEESGAVPVVHFDA